MRNCILFSKEEHLGIKIKVYFGLNSKFYTNVTNDEGYEWSRLALKAAKKKIDFDSSDKKRKIQLQRIRELKKIRDYEKLKRKNGQWHIAADGHVLIIKKNHPFARKGGYVYEHRLMTEEWLRINNPNHPALIKIDGTKYLRRDWIVHHRNWVKTDNRIENFLVIEKKFHNREQTKGKLMEFLEQSPISVMKMREEYLIKHLKTSKNNLKRKDLKI